MDNKIVLSSLENKTVWFTEEAMKMFKEFENKKRNELPAHFQRIQEAMKVDNTGDFQTPVNICKYMVSLIPAGVKTVLEPTKGIGNIVKQLKGYDVCAPDDFFLLDKEQKFDCVTMNPPFSSKYAQMENAPPGYEKHGMRLGYHILTECMRKSDIIIALMPWFTLSDSDVRLRRIKKFGMRSLTALPRKTFQYARIQTVVLELIKNWDGPTEFKVYDLLGKKSEQQQLIF